MEKLAFFNKEHEQRYNQLTEISNKFCDDSDYITAGFMLTIKQETFDKSKKYITKIGINFDGLYKSEDLSGGTEIYIKAVDSLFRWKKFNLSDIRRLDYAFAYGMIEGMQIYMNFESLKKSHEQWKEMMMKYEEGTTELED